MKDYYKILGVKPTSNEAEIRKAYGKLALKYHPDRNKEANATAKFIEVTEAYEVLRDGIKKEEYDRLYNDYNAGKDKNFDNYSNEWEQQGRKKAKENSSMNYSEFVISIYASVWRRLGAALIDLFIISLFMSFIFIMPIAADSINKENFVILFPVLQYAFILIYYTVFESSKWQATIGKKVLKIKVVDEDGNRLTPQHALGRSLGKAISAIILYIGFFMAIWSDTKQALHDTLAKTFVLNDRVGQYNEAFRQTNRTEGNNRNNGYYIVNSVLFFFFLLGFLNLFSVIYSFLRKGDFNDVDADILLQSFLFVPSMVMLLWYNRREARRITIFRKEIAVYKLLLPIPIIMGVLLTIFTIVENERIKDYAVIEKKQNDSIAAVKKVDSMAAAQKAKEVYEKFEMAKRKSDEAARQTILDAENTDKIIKLPTTYALGSNKSEVLRLQGDPISVRSYEILNEEVWYFEYGSHVLFRNGRVAEYTNNGNLNIKLK